MRKRQGPRPTPSLDTLSSFMPGLQGDRKRLTEIQSAYDNLTLLGQLLCAGTDITGMRQDFNQLAAVLLEQLASEHYKKAALNLDAGARVAIDILTRNLYERTADIGFLATDDEIRRFAEAAANDPENSADPGSREALQAHFAEYVRKYSVYHNIILLAPNGEVLAQLDSHNPVSRSADRLLAEALSTEQAYVEVFRPTDLLPGEPSPLIYAYRVMSADGTQPVGVLCLCFRFQDECQRIFDSLVAEDDWTVITVLDAEGRVIASSDANQFPLGVRLAAVNGENCQIIRFAGREYLATTRPAHGYQGYMGPGWVGHALAPLNHAFEMAEAHELEQVPEDFLNCVLATATLFSPELQAIPLTATNIQHELNRAVWNGYVWLIRNPAAAQNAAFAKVLLREIGSTGLRTRKVFSDSTTNLYKTVLSSVLLDCGTQAALAIDIMDRNLYERANDCRWWALTGSFRAALQHPDPENRTQRQQLTETLRQINRLYTVYSNLILFDASGRVLAVSNPAYNDLPGQILNESWVRPTLGLSDSECYAASPFVATPLYAGQPTYIFTAAVREPNGNEPLGGIAIVFDATPQFEAMLHDALPRQADGQPLAGAFAVFADRNGRVIASTSSELPPGQPLMIGYEFFNLPAGESCANVIIFNGCYYAVGSTMSAGYREYKATGDAGRRDVVALVFSPLSDRIIDADSLPGRREAVFDKPTQRHLPAGESVEIACFHIGRSWYGIRSSDVIEAVNADRLTPMPGLSNLIHGCLIHNGQAISVVDLSTALAGRQTGSERRATVNTGKRQIVILHSAQHQAYFGVLVDQLGNVAEVPSAHIEPLPDMMSEGNSLIESLVKPQTDDERRILIVLSAERILNRVNDESMVKKKPWLPTILAGSDQA